MPRDRLETIQKQDRARQLHIEGWSWQQVADELGYRSRSAAYEAAQRSVMREPSRQRAEVIETEDTRLNWLIHEAVEIYKRRHFVVAGKDGVVVVNPETGLPLDDDGPKLQALHLIKALSESRRKLHGADAPSRKIVEVVSEDVIDAEIRRLERELAERPVVSSDEGVE